MIGKVEDILGGAEGLAGTVVEVEFFEVEAESELVEGDEGLEVPWSKKPSGWGRSVILEPEACRWGGGSF